MSIRARLLLLVVLATLPLMLLSGLRFVVDRNDAIGSAKKALDQATDAAANRVANAINGAELLLFGLSQPVAPELIAGGEACIDFLAEVKRLSPVLANVLVFNPNGDAVCDAVGLTRGPPVNQSGLAVFKRAMNFPGVAAAQARVSGASMTGVVNVVLPVTTVPGGDTMMLLLVANVDLTIALGPVGDFEGTVLDALVANRDGQVLLWNRSGIGSRSLVGTTVAGTPLHDRVLGFRGDAAIQTDNDAFVWTVGHAIPGLELLSGTSVVLGAPQAGLTAAADRRFVQDLLVLGVIATLLISISALVAESAVRQLARIHSAVRRLVAGDLSARIAGKYPGGELGDLMAKLDGTIAQFAAIIESSPAALVSVSRSGRVTLWNTVAAQQSGISAKEALGTELRLLRGKYAALLRDTVYRVLLGGQLDAVDFTLPDGDGESRVLAIRSGLMRQTQEHEAVGVLLLITDVTEHRLLQAQLFQSQKLEALGHLTGGIAHDFNNLLTAIMGNSTLLMDRVAGDPLGHEIAESTLMAARHGAELTKSLLAFAKRQPLAPRAVDISELLVKMDGLLQRTLGGHIVCQLRLSAGPHIATVDPAKLESAILNLVTNARDAMTNGGTVTIAVEKASIALPTGARDVVRITVTDDGPGMTQEVLERVFEPFFTTKSYGTGLGMPMVYGFVKQSGGEIRIESKAGAGTAVCLELPSTARPAEASSAPAKAEALGQGEVILVVEDDPRVRRYAELQFEALGYTVVGAPGAAEALEVLGSDQNIDLLFTDLMLPGRSSGDQLVEAALKLRQGLPVLFASGSPEAAGALLRGRGADIAFLAKPYERWELARAVRALLDAAGAGLGR